MTYWNPTNPEKRADSFTDYMVAWRAIPLHPATDAEIQDWLDRAAWLRSRLHDPRCVHASTFLAGWSATARRAGAEAAKAKRALQDEALRADIYWLKTDDGWRVNPSWEAEALALREAAMADLEDASAQVREGLAQTLDALVASGGGA